MTRWRQLRYQLLLGLVALFVLVPIWGMMRLAFDASLRGAPVSFRLVPATPSLDAFVDVWQAPSQSLSFLGLLKNSLLVAGGAALLSVLLGTTMAYAFARFRFPGRKPGLFGLLLGTLLPQVALMTPLYVLLTMLGIRTSLLGLVVVYTAFAMPFCVWNMRAAFQAVAVELEEAAFLEGATAPVVFARVSLPLALPAIGVAALMAFVIGYTEFALGWLFVESGENVTLAMAVSGMLGNAVAWNQLFALAMLMSLPVVLLFLVLQRYLMRGLLLGQIEG
jgi:arabinogalactan oligomer/maltooligosaccharide transport system permease protein